MSALEVHMHLYMCNSCIVWRLMWNFFLRSIFTFWVRLFRTNLGLQLTYCDSFHAEMLLQSICFQWLMYEVQMKHTHKVNLFSAPWHFYFQPYFHQMTFQSHGISCPFKSQADSDHSCLMTLFLTQWYLYMFPKPRLGIYVFTLVRALVGIWQWKWMNTGISTWTPSVFLSYYWGHVIWNQTSLIEPFEALLHNFIFETFLCCQWKAGVCWPRIKFSITPINHTDVKTGA